jgi:hypothetical protein
MRHSCRGRKLKHGPIEKFKKQVAKPGKGEVLSDSVTCEILWKLRAPSPWMEDCSRFACLLCLVWCIVGIENFEPRSDKLLNICCLSPPT